MITIQHKETEKNGVFEAWMRATEEGACTEPVQVGEMTYQRPTPQRMIIDHTRVFDGFEGRGIARQMVVPPWTSLAPTTARSSLSAPTPKPSSPAPTTTRIYLHKGVYNRCSMCGQR